MKETQLLSLALGLDEPWFVQDMDFDAQEGRLDIHLDFRPGAAFACPACGLAGCKVHDSERRTWRHLNFFQHECYLHARLPRVECAACGVKTAAAPWARPGSGFTLLFEALVLFLARHMPVRSIAALTGEHDTRLWRVVRHYVAEAIENRDLSQVQRVGIDETSRRRGHHYISLFVDLDQKETVHVCEGKDAATVESFKERLETHGGSAEQVEEVCCDMSPAFVAGVEAHFLDAEITFDKYHVIALANQALEAVRREEQKENPQLKGSRYAWLKNEENLKADQQALLDTLLLPSLNLKTARAYNLKLALRDFYQQPSWCAEEYLKKWRAWAVRSRLDPMRKLAKSVKEHWHGILRWFESKITNGILESYNSLVQAAKRKARGYRTTENLIAMVYLITGNLKFNLPDYPH